MSRADGVTVEVAIAAEKAERALLEAGVHPGYMVNKTPEQLIEWAATTEAAG